MWINKEKILELRSPESKDIVRRMLEKNPYLRYSASDCLKHKWINLPKQSLNKPKINKGALRAIATFRVFLN